MLALLLLSYSLNATALGYGFSLQEDCVVLHDARLLTDPSSLFTYHTVTITNVPLALKNSPLSRSCASALHSPLSRSCALALHSPLSRSFAPALHSPLSRLYAAAPIWPPWPRALSTPMVLASPLLRSCAPAFISFSFGRALQASVLQAWGGKPENVKAAQDMLRALCQANGMANLGTYDAAKGHPSVTGQLYVKNYVY